MFKKKLHILTNCMVHHDLTYLVWPFFFSIFQKLINSPKEQHRNILPPQNKKKYNMY